jgi:cation-transporting ATPase I
MVEPLRRAGDPVGAARDVASLALRTAGRTVRTGARMPVTIADVLPRQATATARALLDLHPRRTQRRVWAGQGHAHIEVRGLTGSGARHQRLAAKLRRALSAVPGVEWAEINAVTGHVVVAFDERRVDVAALLETVQAVEQAQGTGEEDFPWERPVHPSDTTPIAAAAVELVADCVAAATAVVGSAARMPALPRPVRVGLVLADLQPQLRRTLNRRVGPLSTEVLMSLSYAAVLGLSQRPVGPAIDAVHRAQVLLEVLARRAVWEAREPELCTPGTLPQVAPVPAPRQGPPLRGPVEAWTERLGPATLAGSAAVLALLRDGGRAGDIVLAALPRAARLGREAFAATAATDLAGRGIVPLDPSAYRRLDCVSAILIDSSLLSAGLTSDQSEDQQQAVLASALLDAARASGARVVLTDDATRDDRVAELLARADEVLSDDESLTGAVRRLQDKGEGVLLVSGAADEALAAADVGVAPMGTGGAVCWSADLLCGPSLEDAWRVLQVTAAARPLSEEVVRLTQASSALSAVLALTGRPRRIADRYASAPVHVAALAGLARGTWAARQAARRPPPAAPS